MMEELQRYCRAMLAVLAKRPEGKRTPSNLRRAPGNEYYFDGDGFWPDEVKDDVTH